MVVELEHTNRMTIAGFKKYFSQRPEHFRDIYHCEYTDESAKIAHRESKALVKKCRGGDSNGILG